MHQPISLARNAYTYSLQVLYLFFKHQSLSRADFVLAGCRECIMYGGTQFLGTGTQIAGIWVNVLQIHISKNFDVLCYLLLDLLELLNSVLTLRADRCGGAKRCIESFLLPRAPDSPESYSCNSAEKRGNCRSYEPSQPGTTKVAAAVTTGREVTQHPAMLSQVVRHDSVNLRA